MQRLYKERAKLEDGEIIIQLWSNKDWKKERELMNVGWFTVRELGPVARTETLATLFTQEVRSTIRRYLNDAPSVSSKVGVDKDWYPIKSGDVFVPPSDDERVKGWRRKLSSLIRFRQYIDELGIPYETAVADAVQSIYFEKAYIMKFRSLPCPTVMNSEVIRQQVLLKWVERIEGKIQFVDDPAFHVDPSRKITLDHEAWIIDQIEKKSRPEFAARTFVSKGFVRKEEIKKRLPALIF